MNKMQSVLLKLYYFLKPGMPRGVQLELRKIIARKLLKMNIDEWPINSKSDKLPPAWRGWPDKKKFAVVLRHDVESIYGLTNIWKLVELEENLGFKSSFNFSPERYNIPETIVQDIKNRGFEVGLHGLSHDGKLYSSKREFTKRSVRINKYLKDWDVSGFVSPSTHHNFEWISELNILYDSSSFDTDPFEPQPDAVNTIFPFLYTSKKTGKNYIELPYTLPQDSTLFIILGERNIDIWKSKVDWIVENNGMILLNTHPDYMCFDGSTHTKSLYSHHFYEEILEYIITKYHGQFINFLAKEIAYFWKSRK